MSELTDHLEAPDAEDTLVMLKKVCFRLARDMYKRRTDDMTASDIKRLETVARVSIMIRKQEARDEDAAVGTARVRFEDVSAAAAELATDPVAAAMMVRR